jgi:hypothetical protein
VCDVCVCVCDVCVRRVRHAPSAGTKVHTGFLSSQILEKAAEIAKANDLVPMVSLGDEHENARPPTTELLLPFSLPSFNFL